jgi:hypothetical protein
MTILNGLKNMMFNQILSISKKIFILIIISCCWIFSLKAQTDSGMMLFPNQWLGIWEGELHIYKGQEVVQKVPMRVDNLGTDNPDVYIWALTYGTDTIAGRRNYLLKAKDRSRGVWEVDEQNGIFLEGKVVGNTFINVFSVMENTLISSMSVENDETMKFEIIVYTKESTSKTGDLVHEGENIPAVFSYSITGYQKAVLKKVRNP